MTNHLEGREALITALREELVGPSAQGDPIELVEGMTLEKVGDFYRAWHQAGTGEEILSQDRPTKRYGVGVLYPTGVRGEDGGEGIVEEPVEDAEPVEEGSEGPEVLGERALAGIEAAKSRRGRGDFDQDLDFEIQGVNEFKPSAMALTFLLPDGPGDLRVDVTGGLYRRWTVRSGDRDWR